MDKESRNWFEILMAQVEALGVRIRKLEEADPTPWLKGLDRRVGALEAASGLAQRPDKELVIKVVHTGKEAGGTRTDLTLDQSDTKLH
jgi:hypothetical protein